MSDRDQPKAAQKAGASLIRWVDAADGGRFDPRRLAESGGTADYRHSAAGHPGNPGSQPGGVEYLPEPRQKQPTARPL